ncbi:PDZ domain-containing protein [Desulfonatronum thioautotrophicum]|uniref:PDZ domain-containing protein n=1 Tax=Desulfonatronum thioautotrophicum TaxID=617001 RepID=UPI001294682B|nr:PDZ domain-containing protein [Desulfonatronum thioautotrophicum]
MLLPLAFGLAVAFVLTGAWQRYSLTAPMLSNPSPVIADAATVESWTAVILDANILGLDIPELEPAAPGLTGEATSFDWRLLGTVTGQAPRAIVRREDDFTMVRPGDLLGGWMLEEVNSRSAVFVFNGQREEVRLWAGPPETMNLDTSAVSQEVRSWSAPEGGTRVSLSRQEAQPLLSDPNALLQMASFKPFTIDGRVSGFQVLSIRPDSVLYRVGLRNGDVLARINGQTLTGPTQLLQAYAGMDRSSVISLDVQRASQMQTFIVELRE